MTGTSLVLRRPAFLGVATAVVFLCASLVPGLLPLSWSTQGIISGFWMAIGYGLGTDVSRIYWKIVGLRPREAIQTAAWTILFVLSAGITGWTLLIVYQWQVDVRKLMGMSTAILYYPVAFVVVACLSRCSSCSPHGCCAWATGISSRSRRGTFPGSGHIRWR